jgi:hypothetical protein
MNQGDSDLQHTSRGVTSLFPGQASILWRHAYLNEAPADLSLPFCNQVTSRTFIGNVKWVVIENMGVSKHRGRLTQGGGTAEMGTAVFTLTFNNR